MTYAQCIQRRRAKHARGDYSDKGQPRLGGRTFAQLERQKRRNTRRAVKREIAA